MTDVANPPTPPTGAPALDPALGPGLDPALGPGLGAGWTEPAPPRAAPPWMPGPPPPPPRRAAFGPAKPVDPAPWRLLGWVALGGVVFDVGIRGGLSNLVVALGLAAVVLALLADRRLARPDARWMAALAVVPAAALAFRASPWLAATNLVAVAGLVGGAVVLSRSGSIFDTSPARLLSRSAEAAWRALIAPVALQPLLSKPSGATARRVGKVALAVLAAGPLLAILTLLLAAADPVFAGLVTPDVDLGPALGHVVLAGLFGGLVLMTVAASLGDGRDGGRYGRFGAVETLTMLGLAAAVLGLFVVAQLVALTEAGDRLVEAAGLTPAEYARSGFFQLCWATALIIGFLAFVGFLAEPAVLERRSVRVLSGVVPLLALGLVVVSLRRMALYDEAFGLTMLRLWVVGVALWLGIVLLMIGARNLGLGGGRQWVVGAAGAAALVLVVGADIANPEAFVVHHNVARAEDGAELDLDYLVGLSDDAVPAMVDELGPAAFNVETGSSRYGDGRDEMRCTDDATGVAALNLAVAHATEVRADTCN